MTLLAVTCSVTTDSPENVARAIEAFGRAAAGMALETGVEVCILVGPVDDDEPEPDAD